MRDGDGLRISRDGAVVRLTLDRPAARNALSRGLKAALEAALARIAGDEGVRAVVLTGAGDRAFCAGNDIRERVADPDDPADAAAHHGADHRLADALEALPQPVICAINGAAMGGGLELALACDLRLAVAEARLGLPEVKIGAMPSIGGTQRLARLVGAGWARRLAFTGDPVSGEEAARLGLVEAAPPDLAALHHEAERLAARIAAAAPGAVRAVNRALRLGERDGHAAGLAAEIL
ncbi:MAG: enoyl-CoA hydratase/isomerase family protein, partial [Pseudomonadota bacterium]